MENIKVGDRVRVLEVLYPGDFGFALNQEGRVTAVSPSECDVTVQGKRVIATKVEPAGLGNPPQGEEEAEQAQQAVEGEQGDGVQAAEAPVEEAPAPAPKKSSKKSSKKKPARR